MKPNEGTRRYHITKKRRSKPNIPETKMPEKTNKKHKVESKGTNCHETNFCKRRRLQLRKLRQIQRIIPFSTFRFYLMFFGFFPRIFSSVRVIFDFFWWFSTVFPSLDNLYILLPTFSECGWIMAECDRNLEMWSTLTRALVPWPGMIVSWHRIIVSWQSVIITWGGIVVLRIPMGYCLAIWMQ